ncbi:hypothetical protein ABVT39_012433 [Epinephelus coioides]
MMSYLWILLLGSLLAAGAKAQDDATPKEEAEAPAIPTPEAEAVPEDKEEPAADEEAEHNHEEITPTASEPEPAADDKADEAVTPAVELAEPLTPTQEDAKPDEDANPATPAQEDIQPTTPAHKDADPAAPADEDAEAVTPAAADTEEEAPAATPEPAADVEDKDAKAEEPTADGEEEATSSAGATPAKEEESGPEATPAADPAVSHDEEKPTEAPAAAYPTVPPVSIDVEHIVPVEKAPEVDTDTRKDGFENNPVQGHSEADAHASGAKTNDKPEAQEGSSSSIAGILCAIAVAVVGAIVGYFTYQKKKLCFKNRQEADPEAARKADAAEAQSDPQVLSNLLTSS